MYTIYCSGDQSCSVGLINTRKDRQRVVVITYVLKMTSVVEGIEDCSRNLNINS